MGNPPGRCDASEATTQHLWHSPRQCVILPNEIMNMWTHSIVSVRNPTESLDAFVVQLQTASRTFLSKRHVVSSILAARLPRVSSVTSLTREARYARAEAALRVALSRCDTEPSPLELQVRILEKGLQAWNARAGRGYERVQKAEEALAAARQDAEGLNEVRRSFSELQREKWMGMKERGEALAMVEKIKGLIKELNTDIKGGLKASPNSLNVDPASQKTSDSVEETLVGDTASKKAAILFSGTFPLPYLEKLPRSRRSVEPLQLPLQVTNYPGRQRSSTLPSEPARITTSTPSTSTAQPSTPYPTTLTDDFGAAFIHTPFPLKSVAQYRAEIEESGLEEKPAGAHGNVRLPSYVGALLDELSEDRIGSENLHVGEVVRPFTHRSPSPNVASTKPTQGMASAMSPLANYKKRSKGLLGRPFSSPPSARFHSRSPSQYLRSKENHDPSITLQGPSVDSVTTSGEAHPFSKPTTEASPSSPPLTSPTSDASSSFLKQQIKGPGRVGNLMQSVKKGVKRVSRGGE